MSAVDGRRNAGRKPVSDETRAVLAQRGREMQDRKRGFAIPLELRDRARKIMRDWYNARRYQRGEPRRMPPDLLRAALGLVLLLAIVTPASSHSWYSGTQDPVTKLGCCGTIDCKEISDEDVREQPGGAFLYIPTGETIEAARVQQSRDWRFHRCEYTADIHNSTGMKKKGDTRCFFVPPGSF